MPKQPARKKGARRLNVTPELLANIRHRYEHSAERLATMAADLGCCTETVRAIARRERWVRYEAPPRDLSPAARLRERAEALSSYPPPCGEGGERSEPGGGPSVSTTATPTPDPSPHTIAPAPPKAAAGGGGEKMQQGGREKEEAGGGEMNAALHAAATAQMLHEVAGFLDGVRAERQRMKREGYAKHELQDVARVIADLSASLNRLKPMAPRAAEPDTGNAQDDSYDDRPADLDAFRNDLARQIDALLEEPPDEGDCAQAADGEAAAPQP